MYFEKKTLYNKIDIDYLKIIYLFILFYLFKNILIITVRKTRTIRISLNAMNELIAIGNSKILVSFKIVFIIKKKKKMRIDRKLQN